VRNHNRRPLGLLHKLVQRRLHNLLACRVQSTRRLVEQQHGGILDHGARNRNALLLPTGEESSLLPHVCVKLVGKLLDKVVGVGHPRRLLHLLPRRPGLAARDVVGDRPGEEHRLLPHQPNLRAQPSDVEGGDIVSVQHHLAGAGVVEALDELDGSALAAARRPNERNRGPGGDLEVVPVAHSLVRARGVREVRVNELNVPPHSVELGPLLGRVVNLGHTVHNLEDATGSLGSLCRIGCALGSLPHARPEHKHAEDGDEHALKLGVGEGGDGRVVVADVDPPVPVHEGKRKEQCALRVALNDAHRGALGHLLPHEVVHGSRKLLVHLGL